MFDGCHHGLVYRNIYVTNDHGYVSFIRITLKSSSNSWRITRFVMESNMTGATSGADTAYPSGAPEFTLVVMPISIVCILLLLYMASDYHFGISKTIRFILYLPVRTITSRERRRAGNQIILSVAYFDMPSIH